MKTASVQYQGDLRIQATHDRSGQTLTTDAPVDNQGKGESFSPTDLLATATLTCMITIMGITANTHSLNMGEVSGSVVKHMASNPRRVSALDLEIAFRGHGLNEKGRKILEAAALACPVARSIHPDIQLVVKFDYE